MVMVMLMEEERDVGLRGGVVSQSSPRHLDEVGGCGRNVILVVTEGELLQEVGRPGRLLLGPHSPPRQLEEGWGGKTVTVVITDGFVHVQVLEGRGRVCECSGVLEGCVQVQLPPVYHGLQSEQCGGGGVYGGGRSTTGGTQVAGQWQ